MGKRISRGQRRYLLALLESNLPNMVGRGWVADIGDCCPVQGYGVVDGCPLYFHARGEHVSLAVAPPGVDPVDVSIGTAEGFYWEVEHGTGYEAGYLTHAEARRYMDRAVAAFRASPWGRRRG